MTAKHHGLVAEFATTFGHPLYTTPEYAERKLRKLRIKLLREEYTELIDAAEAKNLVEIADGLGDVAYIAHGTLHAYGLPYTPRVITAGQGLAYAYQDYQMVERTALQTTESPEMHRLLGTRLNAVIVEVKSIASTFAIPYDEVFTEIHASNMSKLGLDGKPIYHPDGKVAKGPNTFAPRLADVLIAAGHTIPVSA